MSGPTGKSTQWRELAEIDYYAPFFKSWLAFNAWYKGHYPQCKNDREAITEIKKFDDDRNSLFVAFEKLLKGETRDALKFRDDLDGFITALNSETLNNPDPKKYSGAIRFNNVLPDKATEEYVDLLKRKGQKNALKLGTNYIRNDQELIFKGLIEIIYQLRCLLFHGHLQITPETHQAVKYGYYILTALIKDL